MADRRLRHWTVDDATFTDRWEVEADGEAHGWVDRIVSVDGESYDWLVHDRRGDVSGTCATLGDALDMVGAMLDG